MAWGVYHGMLLIVYRLFEFRQQGTPRSRMRHRLGKGMRMVFFFHLVCVSWLLFRAETMTQAWEMLGVIVTDVTFTDFSYYAAGMLLFFTAPLVVLEYWIERSGDLLRVVNSHWLLRATIYTYFGLMLWVFPPLANQVFIYFQF